jgi:hypothetical protein
VSRTENMSPVFLQHVLNAMAGKPSHRHPAENMPETFRWLLARMDHHLKPPPKRPAVPQHFRIEDLTKKG